MLLTKTIFTLNHDGAYSPLKIWQDELAAYFFQFRDTNSLGYRKNILVNILRKIFTTEAHDAELINEALN